MSTVASRGLPANPHPRAKSAAAPPGRPSTQDHAMPPNFSSGPSITARRRVQDTPSNAVPSRRNNITDESASLNKSRRILGPSPTSSISSTSSLWSGGHLNSASSTTLSSEGESYRTKDANQTAGYLHSNHPQQHTSKSSTGMQDDGGISWNKVTEVASAFTQEVTKVWATGLNSRNLTGMNSDTDHEEESHLTRVMRAYHLSKARNPSELPNWLFTERERGLVGGLVRTEARNDDNDANATSGRSRNHSSSVRDLRVTNSPNFPQPMGKSLPVMKASGGDRLKMLRESRRQGLSGRI